MDKMKQYVVFAVLGAVVILAAGWFVLVSPKRSEAADLRAQAASQVASNQQLETELQVLRAQAKDLPKKQAELAKVAAKIPSNPALPGLIRALTAASTAAGVDFVSVTPSAPVAFGAQGGAAPVAAPVAAPAAAAPAPAAGAPAAGAAAAPAAPAAPAATAGTLAAIPVAINVVGDYFEVQQFLASLENLPRAFRVVNLKLVPGLPPSPQQVGVSSSATAEDGRSLTSTITGSVFMAAGAAPATAAAPVAAAAPTAAPAK